jgi:murein DD-endopeptidase MepM/ murein hydrolase activator NlpD
MKKLIGALLLLWSFVFVTEARAVTVYYQPTPYPLKKYDGTTMPQDLNIVHIHDGWLNNYYPSIMTFQRDDKLKIGGWGDFYRAYLNMDLAGLPKDPTNVAIQFRFYPSGSTVTPLQFCIPNSAWDTTVTWNMQPTFLGCTGWLTAPSTDSWTGWYITSWYQNWQNGVWGKYGMMLNPQYNNNNFDFIRSSRYTSDGYRPILQFDFTPPVGMPSFKMPLLGGYLWLLTNEVGGYECMGENPWPDTTHQGDNYFSLDFSPTNIKDGGGSYSGSIPILAAAGGTVYGVGYTASTGYYIILDHGNGYLTRYIHFNSPAARKNGTLLMASNTINQGDQIGIMGSLGTGGATHLHMNFWYSSTFNGGSTVANLTKVVMDGWLLKSFQTECAVNSSGVPTSRIRYYHSTNTPTGN